MPRLGPLHTLVFDLDDTLYPEREFVLSGFEAVGGWLESNHGIPGFAGIARRHFEAGHRGKTFDAALAQIGLTPTPEIVDQMVAVYRGHSPALRLAPDVTQVLDWARQHFRLALVSDGYLEVQRRKLPALALGRWIPVAVFTDTMGQGHWKPHPWGFEEVMRQLPGPPAGFGYVGDNPRKDFAGARALGWRTARLRMPEREHSAIEVPPAAAADAEVASLVELRSLLFAVAPGPA